MSVQSKPFYWLECDAPGCGALNPDENDDHAAYIDVESAELMASESDWLIVNGKHYCWDHEGERCRTCGERLTEDELETAWQECFKCAPELVEASAARGAEEERHE